MIIKNILLSQLSYKSEKLLFSYLKIFFFFFWKQKKTKIVVYFYRQLLYGNERRMNNICFCFKFYTIHILYIDFGNHFICARGELRKSGYNIGKYSTLN